MIVLVCISVEHLGHFIYLFSLTDLFGRCYPLELTIHDYTALPSI